MLMIIYFSMFQEVLVRFAGFGPEEDEWINIRRHVRPRSLPCESSECVVVIPGDLILCFQVGIAVVRCHKNLLLVFFFCFSLIFYFVDNLFSFFFSTFDITGR